MEKPQLTRSRADRARLQLLSPPTRPSRVAYVPSRRVPRRPGERREPLSIDVPRCLRELADARGIDPACAAELCLERALVLSDLAAVDCSNLYDELLKRASSAPITLPLPGAAASYLQTLLVARDHRDLAASAAPDQMPLTVALRLFPRVYSVIDELGRFGEVELGQALALEIAAVANGRTMSEWAAVAALMLRR
jgi:hypothetical protein